MMFTSNETFRRWVWIPPRRRPPYRNITPIDISVPGLLSTPHESTNTLPSHYPRKNTWTSSRATGKSMELRTKTSSRSLNGLGSMASRAHLLCSGDDGFDDFLIARAAADITVHEML